MTRYENTLFCENRTQILNKTANNSCLDIQCIKIMYRLVQKRSHLIHKCVCAFRFRHAHTHSGWEVTYRWWKFNLRFCFAQFSIMPLRKIWVSFGYAMGVNIKAQLRSVLKKRSKIKTFFWRRSSKNAYPKVWLLLYHTEGNCGLHPLVIVNC